MKKLLPRILTLSTFSVITLLLVISTPIVQAATATHIVISEVQIAGVTTTDEFVELYNPTENDIDLENFRLARKTAGGTESNLVSTLSGTIRSHGYFLIAHPDHTGSTSADQSYSEDDAIAANNTVLLYGNDGTTVIDKLGFTGASDFEGATESSPGSGTSRERQANSTSTQATMAIGGIDEFNGNGEDTDNNASDFVARTLPQPQNSLSSLEPVPTQTPTETPTDTPTETPTDTPSPTPTDEVTPTPTEEVTPTPTEEVTPTPTEEVTPTPTEEVTPTPTEEVTPTPTEEVTPTPTEEVTPTPTEEVTPTPTEEVTPTVTVTSAPTVSPTIKPPHNVPSFLVVCSSKTITVKVFTIQINVSVPSCKIVKS